MLFKEHKVLADGECLFNAIAYGILYRKSLRKPSVKTYKKLASKIREYVTERLYEKVKQNNQQYIVSMALEYNPNSTNLVENAKKYVKRMKKSCAWGGQIEISVLGTFLNRYNIPGLITLDDNLKKIKGMHTRMRISDKNKALYIKLNGVNMGGIHFNYLEIIKPASIEVLRPF